MFKKKTLLEKCKLHIYVLSGPFLFRTIVIMYIPKILILMYNHIITRIFIALTLQYQQKS